MGRKRIFASCGFDPLSPNIPDLVSKCITFFLNPRSGGLKTVGIFQKDGNPSEVLKLRKRFLKAKPGKPVSLEGCNPLDVATMLKHFLEDLPNSLLTIELHDCFIAAAGVPDPPTQLQCMRKAVSLLPPGNRALLHCLLQFFGAVLRFSAENKMTAVSLAVNLAPCFLRAPAEEEVDASVHIADTTHAASVVEILLTNHNFVFPPSSGFTAPADSGANPSEVPSPSVARFERVLGEGEAKVRDSIERLTRRGSGADGVSETEPPVSPDASLDPASAASISGNTTVTVAEQDSNNEVFEPFWARALFSCVPDHQDDLGFEEDDLVLVIDMVDENWWQGECHDAVGIFPSSYVERIPAEPKEPKHQQTSGPSPGALCVALYSFETAEMEELPFRKGDVLTIVEVPPEHPEWWIAQLGSYVGRIPFNRVRLLESGEDPSNLMTTTKKRRSTHGPSKSSLAAASASSSLDSAGSRGSSPSPSARRGRSEDEPIANKASSPLLTAVPPGLSSDNKALSSPVLGVPGGSPKQAHLHTASSDSKLRNSLLPASASLATAPAGSRRSFSKWGKKKQPGSLQSSPPDGSVPVARASNEIVKKKKGFFGARQIKIQRGIPPYVDMAITLLSAKKSNHLSTPNLFSCDYEQKERVKTIKKKIEKGKTTVSLADEPPHILAGLLVRFLEDLHIALISEGPYDCVVMAMREDTRMEQLVCLRSTIEEVMPQWNLLVLIRVLGLLRDYLEQTEKNKSSLVKLSVIFAPLIMRSRPGSEPSTPLDEAILAIEYMLDEYGYLFLRHPDPLDSGERTSTSSSRPSSTSSVKFQEAFKRASMQLTSDLHLQLESGSTVGNAFVEEPSPAAAAVTSVAGSDLEDGELVED